LRIDKVTPVLYAESPRTVVQFYVDRLGFSIDTAHPSLDDPDVLVLDHGSVSIMYYRAGPMPVSSGQINFDVEDLDPFLTVLGSDHTPEWGPETFDYGRREFGVRDPNGILVVFSMPARCSDDQ